MWVTAISGVSLLGHLLPLMPMSNPEVYHDAIALWWGLTAGLVLISALVLWRIWVVLRRPLPDEPAELAAA